MLKIKNKHTLSEDQRYYLIQLLKSGKLVNTRTNYHPCFYHMTSKEDGEQLAKDAGLVYYFDRELA